MLTTSFFSFFYLSIMDTFWAIFRFTHNHFIAFAFAYPPFSSSKRSPPHLTEAGIQSEDALMLTIARNARGALLNKMEYPAWLRHMATQSNASPLSERYVLPLFFESHGATQPFLHSSIAMRQLNCQAQKRTDWLSLLLAGSAHTSKAGLLQKIESSWVHSTLMAL